MNATTTPTTKHTFLTLDALRGVAAFAVVLFHYMGEMFNYTWRGLPSAYLAVDFFFILSGFVIAHAYEERIKAGMTLNRFVLLRLIRLYPLFWVGSTIMVFGSIIKSLFTGKALTLSVISFSYILGTLFLPTPTDYLSPSHSFGLFPYNPPAWSLSLEMGINLIFVVTCFWLTTKRLGLIVLAAGLSLLYGYYYFNNASLGVEWHHYWGGWARVTFSFFAGVLLHRYFVSSPPLALSPWCGLALSGALLVIFLIPDTYLIIPILSCFIFFPAIVWLGARATVWQPLAGLCAWLGRISYAVYITHRPMLDVFMYLANRFMGENKIYVHPKAAAMIMTALAIMTAALLDRLYDVPARNYLTRKYRERYAR